MRFPREFLDGFSDFKRLYFTSEHPLYATLIQGQKPKALVVACSDSRVDPALMLGCKPGDIFVIRNVANIVPHKNDAMKSDAVMAAMAYGILHLNIEHVILLGHSNCGGIAALLRQDKEQPQEFISPWVSLARQAVSKVKSAMKTIPEISIQRSCEQVSLLISLDNMLSYHWIAEKIKKQCLTVNLLYFDLEAGELLSFSPLTKTFEQITIVGAV